MSKRWTSRNGTGSIRFGRAFTAQAIADAGGRGEKPVVLTEVKAAEAPSAVARTGRLLATVRDEPTPHTVN
jgi:hypothetical protein